MEALLPVHLRTVPYGALYLYLWRPTDCAR